MTYALLVIDVQNDYFAPDGKLPLPGAETALERIHVLLDGARAKGIPIVHVRHEQLDPNSPVFRSGTVGVEFHPSIRVLPGENEILKHLPGSFTGTPLAQILHASGAGALIICGYMTQQCCEMTTRQAFELGMPVRFASDATAARALTFGDRAFSAEEIHEASLAVIAQYATVSTVSDILAELEAQLVAS
jgi:nicotinamidase-related amidase